MLISLCLVQNANLMSSFVLCFSPLHLSKQHNHQELSFSSFACFHRISNPCGLHGLHSSILQRSKSFDTFSPLFPQTSCNCRVLFSIQQALQ